MTERMDVDRLLDAYLAPEADRIADRVIDGALLQIETTPQARSGLLSPWRPFVNTPLRISFAALAAVMVLGAALLVATPRSSIGGPSAVPPSPSRTAPAAERSAAPTQGSTSAASQLVPTAQIIVRYDGGLIFAYDSLWIGDQSGVQRIDPGTNTASTTVPITGAVNRLWDDGKNIVVSTIDAAFTINPSTNVATPAPANGMPAFGAAWSIDSAGTLHKFDLATGNELGSVSVDAARDWQPQMAAGDNGLWIAEGTSKQLVRVDPKGPTVVTRITGFAPDDSLFVAGFAFNSVWMQSNAAGGSGILYRIDPATNKIVATIPVGEPANGTGYGGTVLAFSSDAVWTADSSGTVTRVDPTTNTVVAVKEIDLPNVEWIAYGANSIWVRNQNIGQVQRYDASAWSAP